MTFYLAFAMAAVSYKTKSQLSLSPTKKKKEEEKKNSPNKPDKNPSSTLPLLSSQNVLSQTNPPSYPSHPSTYNPLSHTT